MSAARFLLGLLVPPLMATVAIAQTIPGEPTTPAPADANELLERPARLRIQDVPLPIALIRLDTLSGVSVAFSPSLVSEAYRVSCSCERTTVREALDRMLTGTPYRYTALAGQVVVEPRGPGSARSFAPSSSPAEPASDPERQAARGAGRPVRVAGTVVQANTLRAIPAVQISIPAAGIGTLTDTRGGFQLLNVPPGEVVLRAQRIGFEPIERRVSLSGGDEINVRFAMTEAALALDEIVITGTAGAARRREVGNSIAQIRMADLVEVATSVDAVLQGRTAGMVVMENAGRVGAGASIRLRGNVSAAMSNQPLIYVDGVRIRGEGLPKNVSPIGYDGRGPNTTYSPLNDINPADIDRIEIIKGAAATTLYGTEAAAGVIQIFTRQGQAGASNWTLQVDQGLNLLRPFGPTQGMHGEALTIPKGEEDPAYMFMEPFLRTGKRDRYHLSVGGGSEAAGYFLSGAVSRQEGVLPNDREQKVSIRGNMNFAPMRGLHVSWNSAFTNNDLEQTAAGPDGHGITINASRRDRNYFGTRDEALLSQLLDFESRTSIDHFTAGIAATYAPSTHFTNRLTLGYDLIQQQARSLRPFGWLLAPEGIAHETRWRNATLTFDYVQMLHARLGPQLTSTFAVGGQSVTSEESSATAYGEKFPGPGRPTISSAALTLGFQDLTRVVTAGLFVQEVLSYKDRYFLTTGLRMDGNSAFGKDLGLQVYPKVSFSYVLSDEAFWPSAFGQMKLRAAYGEAGRAPGAFDAVRTWDPVGWGGQPAFRPLNVGNSDLGPERTGEVELGADASLLRDRLSVEFTYYRQRTSRALFWVRQPPSGGFLADQLANVGELENKGVEVVATADVIRAGEWAVTIGGTAATNRSRVLALGAASPFSIGNYGWILEGQPVPAIRGDCVRNPEETAAPVIEAGCIYGPNLPTLTLGMHSRVRLPRSVTVSAHGEYQQGGWGYSTSDGESYTRGIRWPSCFNAYEHLDAGRPNELTALERARCIPGNARRDFAIFPLDFFKLREATVMAPLPLSLPGAARSEVAISARNALRWKRAENSHFDPEDSGGFLRGDTGMQQQTRSVGGSIPLPAVYTLSVRVRF